MTTRRRGNGDGGVYRRGSDNRWVAVLDLGPDGSGRRRRKVLYGTTRREVVEKLTEAQRRLSEGAPVTDARGTVAAYLEHWMSTGLAAAEVRATTRENYTTIARKHLVTALGHHRLDKLDPSDVDALVVAKRAAGLSDSTVRLIYTVLRRALDAAVRDGLIRRNVAAAVQRPRVARRDAAVLSPDQAQTFLDAARGDRLFALYAVAVAVGLRRGEALGLRWSDVDLDVGTLRVSRTFSRVGGRLAFTEPKSQRSRRTVPLPDPLVVELRAHRVRQAAERLTAGSSWDDHDLVFPSRFGTPLDPRNALRALATVAGRAGLDGVGLHTLRHTSASLMLVQGVHPRVVMETLGHSGISITMDVYSHVMPQQQREAAEAVGQALRW